MSLTKKIVTMMQKELIHRYDGDEAVFYYTHTDFEGLHAEPFLFQSNHGDTLVGNFYYYGEKRNDRILVFEHGLGAGHTAYMREIERLASVGYTVFSYDKSGCMASGGESIYAFSQSIADLDACLKSLKALPELKNATFSVIGHSYGAYATLNIAAYHPDITHLVALSGPISAKALFASFLPGPLSLYASAIMKDERKINPDYCDSDARKVLKSYRGKALVIHSEDDRTCKFKKHFKPLKKALAKQDNITFLALNGKDHNPNYTDDAIRYLNDFFSALSYQRTDGALETIEQKHAFRDGYDFARMTEQDDAIWQIILDHLAKES